MSNHHTFVYMSAKSERTSTGKFETKLKGIAGDVSPVHMLVDFFLLQYFPWIFEERNPGQNPVKCRRFASQEQKSTCRSLGSRIFICSPPPPLVWCRRIIWLLLLLLFCYYCFLVFHSRIEILRGCFTVHKYPHRLLVRL